MNDIEVSSIDLVEGGNVFKQGHYLTLGYVPRDEKGETVDLSGKTLNVSLWGRKGVVFESAATYSSGVIRFTLDKMVPAGDYTVEFTVTSSTDAKYRKKFPTNQHSGRIAIKQSADDLGVVGIQVYTVAQLKAEQKAIQTQYESTVDAKVQASDAKSATALTKSTTAEATANDVKSQFEQVVISGDSSVEAAAARVAPDQTFVSLKARLDAKEQATALQLAETVSTQAQADYVDIVSNLTGYKRLRVKRTDLSSAKPNRYAVDVVLDNGMNHTTYQWQKNDNDDFLLLNQAFVGDFSRMIFNKIIVSLNGSFVTSSAASYTTTVGSTFTATVKGDEIVFQHYADNRGGIWEFIIDGNTAAPITISTFSATTVAFATKVLATGLENKNHSVLATYKGADTLNPPTGGTARGWLNYSATPANNNQYAILGYVQSNPLVVGQDLLAYASNKEFALSITKNGVTHWFPEHNSIGTCFIASPIKFLLDDKEIDFSQYADMEYIEGKTFKIVEHMYCRFPSSLENLAELRIIYVVGIDGKVSISGSITALQDVIASGYFMMFPLGRGVNELVSGIGNSKINSGDDSKFYFPAEGDKVVSYAAVDPVKKNYIAAMTVDYPYKTLRYGKTGRTVDLTKFTYFLQRPQAPKLYQVSVDNKNLVAGESLNFFGRFAVAEIPNIYNYIK